MLAGVATAAAAAAVFPAAAAVSPMSPYVFDREAVHGIQTRLKARIEKQFGPNDVFKVVCVGRYPGRHAGHVGYHEVFCKVAGLLFDEPGSHGVRGDALYWIDAHRRTRVRKTVVVV